MSFLSRQGALQQGRSQGGGPGHPETPSNPDEKNTLAEDNNEGQEGISACRTAGIEG